MTASRSGKFAVLTVLLGLVVLAAEGACAQGSGEFEGGTGGSGGDPKEPEECDPGFARCGDVCVNRQKDAMHCGACNKPCGAGEVCQAATCVCAPDRILCGTKCVDVKSDPLSCGGCDNPCPTIGPPNTTPTCINASCGSICKENFEDCNKLQGDGCEVNTSSDVENCGGCDKICNKPENTQVSCSAGMCGVGSCEAGFDDCDMEPANGCETNTEADTANCGDCKVPCGPGQPCENGICLNINLTDVFSSYTSEGRTVYIWKTPPCAPLANFTNFCPDRGLVWWKPKSQVDAQKLIDFTYNLDNSIGFIQVYGIATDKVGKLGAFPVIVNGPGCTESSADGWSGFRKWSCSFCDPESNLSQPNNGESCCWDKGNTHDWFVCEP